ncbi:hypothetical protein H072_3962 [Dactylellina haptotyla CBS 200.50]|uniref:Uncharacterized protein n=1 Tax=Dactylellina haptotyla (strain CBS 200.50) TaxID=1284197 RepID=S8C377_DACHA|nr:hypothetical protein H072_3962 [Dactylellina haptotyla CBS 200.50]
MAEEIDDRRMRRCVSEPPRQPLQQRVGPKLTSRDPRSDRQSGEDSRPYIGVSETGARVMQQIPYIMSNDELNLQLGPLFAPVGEEQAAKEQTPLAMGIPGNPKPFLALFHDKLSLSVIRESFYNEYFAPDTSNITRGIPTEHGILRYNDRSIVKFNKGSPLYISENFTQNMLVDVNKVGLMEAIGLTMIPFCFPHDNKKTHWVQALVVKELFPFDLLVQNGVAAVFAAREFAARITFSHGIRGVPHLHTDPIGLYLQDGYLQVWVASQYYEPGTGSELPTQPQLYLTRGELDTSKRHYGVGVFFSEDSAFNVSRQWYWHHGTYMRREPFGDIIAVITLFRHLTNMAELRGIMRKVKGITIHLAHTVALGMLNTIRHEGGIDQYEFKEAWFKRVKHFFDEIEGIGWKIKLQWVEHRNNQHANDLAFKATNGMVQEPRYSDHEIIEKACDDLAISGTFDIGGIHHDENTNVIQVRDADWENMRVPPFLKIRYEEPLDSLMRQLETAEAEHDPHYNNEAIPEEDIFNPANFEE